MIFLTYFNKRSTMINIGPKCKLALVDVVRFPYFFKIISPPTKSIKKTGIVDEVASCISYRLWVNFFRLLFWYEAMEIGSFSSHY